jgi:hypothetical protein
MVDERDLTLADQEELRRMTIATGNDLMQTIAQNMTEKQLSILSLPEMQEVADVVSRVIPAGNVPGLIASGLMRLEGNAPPPKDMKRDVGMIFRGMNQMFDKAVYGGLFAMPARIIWGYQNLLKLTGRDLEAAFPEGTWQFYVDYALREDTARHTNESYGFDHALRENRIQLSERDRIVAWVMTAIHTLHNYPSLLENEWRERVYIRKLIDLSEDEQHQKKFSKLFQKWLSVLPYRRMADARGDEDYPSYRHRKFDEWLFEYVNELPRHHKKHWLEAVNQAKQTELQAYINQMSILGYLAAEQYSEVRTALDIKDLHISLIYQSHYYLIPACEPNTNHPADVERIRQQITALLEQPSQAPAADLQMFVQVQRSQWPQLEKKLPKSLREELGYLRSCPMMLNFDPRNHRQALAEIRLAERGIGDHALTIFDTRETFVFDQSHIYFDGAWGAALAEIMTNEALAWASYLQHQPKSLTGDRPYSPELAIPPSTREHISKMEQIIPEVTAENDAVRLDFVLALRRLFKQRNDLLQLSVNDLLLLYRAIHAITYQTDASLITDLNKLKADKFSREAAEAALKALQPDEAAPAIMMLVDASRHSPRDRLYPMSFEVPLLELNLLQLHQAVIKALDAYEGGGGGGGAFDKLQRQYLRALAGFGEVMSKAKEIANAGESASVSSIKLLAHIPLPLQSLLNEIPGRFDMLNDIIKGREIFSNVGQVAKSSTLRRFITAKDDNEKKTLAWGILSDADGVMRITLRDFRPHVGMLLKIGQRDLAKRITQDYLDSYAHGFNRYLADVQQITLKSRETRMMRD